MDIELINRAKRADISVLNIPLKSEGKTLRSVEHSSLIFKVGLNGYWVFAWNAKNLKGDLIKFVQEYHCLSFKDAISYLTGETATEIKPETIDKFKITHELSMPEKAKNMHRAIAYLNKSRGIKQATIQFLIDKKLMYQDEKGNIVFVWKDIEGKENGAELNGTLTSKRFKGIAQGSKFGHGFNIRSGKITKILVFESAIDLLSFTNLYKCSNCILVSMAGLKVEVINTYKSQYTDAELILCIDNDVAANIFIDRNNLSIYKRTLPINKDFNEDLLKNKKNL